MKRILVTGGGGFIGSHTCLTLLENNYEIFVLDSFINSDPSALEKVLHFFKDKKKINKSNFLHLIKGDLRNIEIIDSIFKKSKIEGNPINGVIHFAGLKAVGESFKDPIKYWDFNLTSSINLFRCMQENNCKTIVFSSSATVYGLNKDNLIKENSDLNPCNPYGNTKLSIEKLLYDIFKSSRKDWKIANLRYFNPIGAHFSGLIGENSKGVPNNIFPYILQVAQGNISNLKIYGNDWPTHDGTGIRDYIHVMDLAEAHFASLEYLFLNQPQYINLNIGTGIGTSVLELINAFENSNNIKIPFIFTERREGDVDKVVADNSLALKVLNWRPKRNLETMCIDGWNWKRLNPNGY